MVRFIDLQESYFILPFSPKRTFFLGITDLLSGYVLKFSNGIKHLTLTREHNWSLCKWHNHRAAQALVEIIIYAVTV